MTTRLITALFALLATLMGCALAQDKSPVGLTLLFLNKGPYSIGVSRFDPDGQRGPTPGALGANPTEGKQMSFMAGDSKRGVPQFVDVEWSVATPDIEAARKSRDKQFVDYSKPWMEETARINAMTPRYSRRVDLTSILTPELLAQVRANRQNTNLKLVVIFKDEDVAVIAEPEVWRKAGETSLTDSSPAAIAARRAEFEVAQAANEKNFFSGGYYLGTVSGALSGRIVLSVQTSGALSAVITAKSGEVFLLSGNFDNVSSAAVRRLELSTKTAGAQGAMALSGSIDLKAKKMQGTWTLNSASSAMTGDFVAQR